MRCTSLLFCLAIVFSPLEVLVSQAVEQPVNLERLREDVSRELLNERETPMVEVVDHLWKSNGGALVPREYSSPKARALADHLARLMEYDASTQSLYWPVYGFAEPGARRFTPQVLWNVLESHLATHQVTTEDLGRLSNNFHSAFVARPMRYDPLVPPPGLSMAANRLLPITGFYGPRLFVYSPANCFDVAVKCYQLGLFEDALVLLSHALGQTQDEKFFYLRGAIEMVTGRAEDAKMSALGFIATTPNSGSRSSYVHERINGPAAIQFRELVTELSRRAAPILP